MLVILHSGPTHCLVVQYDSYAMASNGIPHIVQPVISRVHEGNIHLKWLPAIHTVAMGFKYPHPSLPTMHHIRPLRLKHHFDN